MWLIRMLLIVVTLISYQSVRAYDFLLEGKAAYFLPTNHVFKNTYHNGGGIYGLEFTGKIYRPLYGFISGDFFSKQGKSCALRTPTKVTMNNIGIGLKYLTEHDWGNLYLGLGALPTHIHTTDCSPYVVRTHKKWGCGGIVKAGAYVDLPHHMFLDFFFDYSFVKIPFHSRRTLPTQLHDANVSGCWFGAGFGFRFN